MDGKREWEDRDTYFKTEHPRKGQRMIESVQKEIKRMFQTFQILILIFFIHEIGTMTLHGPRGPPV